MTEMKKQNIGFFRVKQRKMNIFVPALWNKQRETNGLFLNYERTNKILCIRSYTMEQKKKIKCIHS